MWQKVATEMGVPWRSAESIHWQLGEQEMTARANAPVFQSCPSATGSSSPPHTASVPAPVPIHTSRTFKPANARPTPNSPLVPPQQHEATLPPQQQDPIHTFHQRTISGSSQGQGRNDSFNRRQVSTLSRFSVPQQLIQPMPQAHHASAERLVSRATTAPA